jgi:hypothetical protein
MSKDTSKKRDTLLRLKARDPIELDLPGSSVARFGLVEFFTGIADGENLF